MEKAKKTAKIRHKPVVIKQAATAHAISASLSSVGNAALLALIQICNGPADLPNVGDAVANALAYANGIRNVIQEGDVLIAGMLNGLQLVCEVDVQDLRQPLGLAGRKALFPEWNLITSEAKHMPDSFRNIVGTELIHAYLVQVPFSKSLSKKLNGLVEIGDLSADEKCWLEAQYVERLKKLRGVVDARISGLTSSEVRFNYLINAYLQSQLSSRNVIPKQAAGRRNELPIPDVQTLFLELRAKVEEGDHEAALRCTAFCIGISMELTQPVPFDSREIRSANVSINPVSGTHYCDVSDLLSKLAKVGPLSAVPATTSYERPFPVFLAKYWKTAVATNPTARFVGDINWKRKAKNAARIEDTEISFGIPITEARLIASRGALFMNAGVPRDTAVYACLAPFLLDSSDFHYVLKTQEEIWTACETTFKFMGWGAAVPRPEKKNLAVGTKKSSEKETMRKKITSLRDLAEKTRAGRNYSIESLVRHHNAFVVYVAFMMMFFLGGRNRAIVAYRANAWQAKNPFGLHVDKPASPNQSRVQSPVPNCLSATLKYLYTHYQQLDARLKKLGFPEESGARLWIKAILAGDDINLFFRFDKRNLPRDLRLKDVIHPQDDMAPDTARHFIPRALELEGVHFNYVQAWLKHHAAGVSVNSVTARTPPVVWLSKVARALDHIALDLGLRPVSGISKG